jgi:thiamine kinase-like enzyme
MINESYESPLLGGRTATEVVRIENTVRRPLGPHSEFAHALLRLLEGKKFDHAPQFLGIDDKGREILTFMEGKVPHEEMNWTDDQLVKVVQMIKGFHDATAGNELAGGKEVVCHNDIAPWNTILENDIPTAFIDFDDSAPGNRVDDLAYFLWTFLGIGNDVSPHIHAIRIRKLCDVYGFTEGFKLVDAILEQQERIVVRREMLAKYSTEVERREFSASRLDRIRWEIEWVKANRSILEAAF